MNEMKMKTLPVYASPVNCAAAHPVWNHQREQQYKQFEKVYWMEAIDSQVQAESITNSCLYFIMNEKLKPVCYIGRILF